jgi:ankyrin repeat protein
MKGPRIHAVAGLGDVGTLRKLLGSGVDVDLRDQTNATPLMIAAAAGRLAAVQLLLAGNADPNAADTDGETPLHFATRQYYPEVVQALVEAGANVNAVESQYGNTPLHLAVINAMPGKTETVELLSRAGADSKARSKSGDTPESLAALLR